MKFFQTLIASTLGVFIALFIVFIVFFITLASSTGEPEPYVRDNTVLKIQVQGNIPARTASNPFEELFQENNGPNVSLQTLRTNLEKAAKHDKIKGLWLEIDFVSAGWANLKEAHRLISTFRDSSDKFVYASTNDIGYNEKGYYLATATDSVFSPPESLFEFDGFYSQVTFYTGLFEKIGIESEISRQGKYKSAVEPYIRKELSESSEYQLEQLLNDISGEFIGAVSAKTGKSADEINSIMNGPPNLLASAGFENGLIDSLIFPDEVENHIKKRIGIDKDDELQTISNSRYYRVNPQTAGLSTTSTDNKIAVIYADGIIMPSTGQGSPFTNQEIITASNFREDLDKILDDDDVKALVVRVNSPGGSGMTSDLIWNMLRKASEQIPVITSMGPVAASGGYYISAAADTIVAESTTITGSIGVFSTKFNTRQLFNEELGITFDVVKSHEHADWLNMTRSFTEVEEKAFQQFNARFYDTFLSRVAQSRELTKAEVDSVAQGRVWTGVDAQEQGLVDLLGGLDTATAVAAEKAGIDAYTVENYPKRKDLYQILMGSAQAKVQSWFGDPFFPVEETQKLKAMMNSRKGDPLLIFPYDLNIE